MIDTAPESDATDESGGRLHRRGFFTEGLRHLLKPLAEIVEQRMQTMDPILQMDDEEAGEPYSESKRSYAPEVSPPPPPSFLRPPGALPEAEFLARCTSSGRCVQACPVAAIRLVAAGGGKPAIDPDVQACVLCADLSCMKACPSGALQVVPREAVRIGVARWDIERCLRTRGEDCRICADTCPVGTAAIDIPAGGGGVSVKADGCTGCGVCQMHCPARPRAIAVVLRSLEG